MPLRVPPPEIPIVKWLSPNKADQGLLEFWNTEVASYVPLDVGAEHPNARLYPGFTLGKQAPMQGDEKWVMRIWVTPETSPEWFNYAQKYSGEDNAFPIFIRTYREPKATYQPRAKQSSLGAFYKLVLDNSGSGFTTGTLPAVTFDTESATPALAHGVVSPDGTLAECVLDFCGDGYTGNVAFTVDAPANGNPASGIAYIQPASAILVKEEANLYPEDSEFYAQYFQVVRVYETIPGPTFYETSLDVDGDILTTATTRKLCSDISTGESITDGVWCKTTKKPTDTDFICEEMVVCRAIPGNPMESTKIDEDGKVIDRTQTYTATADCVSEETLATGVWTHKYFEDVDGTNLVSWQWVETRDIPGNNIVEDTIDDRDGAIQVVVRTMESIATITAINPKEYIDTGTYVKVESKAISELVAWKIITARKVPGNDVVEDVVDDRDGAIQSVTRTLVDASTITPSESIVGGNTYRKVEAKPVTDILAWKVTTDRPVPGNDVVKTVIDADGDEVEETRTIVESSTITTTITTSGGVYTKTFQDPITDIIAWKVVQVKATQNELDSFEVSIPDLIPIEFRSKFPVTTTEQTLIGTASLPTLVVGDLSRREAQIDFNTYRLTISGRADISLPQSIVNQELTEEYGGGTLNVTSTIDLASNLTIDEGLTVVSSEIRKLDSQADPLAIKITKQLDGDAWPVLDGTEVDPRTGIVIGIEKQVVAAGATGGVSGSTYTDVKSIDKWRSITIASSLDPDTLPDPVSWETTAEHAFPNTLVAVAWVWDSSTDGACCGAFDMALESEIDQGYSGPCRALVTESFTNGPPSDTVSITQFFPKANEIGYSWGFGNADCGTCGAHAKTWALPPTLHDAITIAGSVIIVGGHFTSTLPATTPIGLPSPGTLITKSVDVERWRFGVFFRRITEIYVPG